MAWTEERVKLLKKHWAEGLPAAKIAEILGDVTRNAVIGKIFRLGLSNKSRKRAAADTPGEQPAKPGTEGANPQDNKGAAGSQALSRNAEEDETRQAGDSKEGDPASNIETARLAEDASPRLTLMQLTEKTCKWPIGDPAKDEFWFCGHPSQPGKPYCEPHNKIAAQPFTSKRDKALQRPQDLSTFARRQ